MLTKEFVERKGETCRASPRKIARRTGGGFSPLRLVASRRHGRRHALLAALPVAPVAPLSQKSRFAAIFREPCLYSGHAFFNARRLRLSCKSAAAQIGAPALAMLLYETVIRLYRPIPPPASRWRRRCNCGPLCARRPAPAPATASCPPAPGAGYRRSRSRGAGCIPLRLRRRRG